MSKLRAPNRKPAMLTNLDWQTLFNQHLSSLHRYGTPDVRKLVVTSGDLYTKGADAGFQDRLMSKNSVHRGQNPSLDNVSILLH